MRAKWDMNGIEDALSTLSLHVAYLLNIACGGMGYDETWVHLDHHSTRDDHLQ